MALQILPAVDRGPSKSEMIAQALTGFMKQGMNIYQQRQQQQQENAALKELTGKNFSGLSPEMKKAALVQALKTQGQKELKAEENKFLDKIFGGNKESINKANKLVAGDVEEPIIETQGKNEGYQPENLSDEDIVRAEVMRHGLGTALSTQKAAAERKKTGADKETRRQFEADRSFHSKTSDPIVEAANVALKEEPVKKGLNAQLKRDIKSGQTSGLFPFIVDRLGLESFRNPESARFSNEIKNKFVSSLQDIPGARPNMFIERVLSTAQPQLGRSEEANLSVMELGDFMDDLNYELSRQIRNVSKEDRKALGYVRNDVQERAEERMGNYANKRQEQMAYDIRRIHEDTLKDDADLLNEIIGGNIPEGTPVTRRTMRLLMIKNKNDSKKAVEEAKSLGMVFPTKEIYERYED